jgi:N-succinyldiaminopimelate aminotransferase
MNPGFQRLAAYPFERLAKLKQGLAPPAGLAHIPLSIGEPRHEPPGFVLDTLRAHLHELDSYPATRGLPELRAAAARWCERRFALPAGSVDGERHVLPVNGTREALFAFVQAVVDSRSGSSAPLVLMPNPGYQIYEGAALLAGAEPYYLNTTAANDFLPDLQAVPAAVWQRCQLLFLCSPANPVGAVMSMEYLQRALQLAEQHDFIIASDECYADLFGDEAAPPPSLLTAAAAMGNTALRRCMTFHSLSKRSSLPGLRSGLVAGDAVPAVSHLSRLRHAHPHAARQHHRVERRRTRGRQPRAVPAQVRSRDSAARARSPNAAAGRWLLPVVARGR